MKKNEDQRIGVQNTNEHGEQFKTSRSLTGIKAGRNIRKLFLIAGIAGAGLFLNGCMSGYVASEPEYVQYNRPQQPSNVHLWIDGDWRWNNQKHGYVQNNGYWVKPRQGRTYIPGSWETNSRGKYWKNGQWVRYDNRGYRYSR